MPTYDKLIDTSTNGLACICFRNETGLSFSEITELFSKYGDIVSINCAGDELGFRFVRYHTKEEALKCAIAMDGNPNIRLQPVKSKPKESKDSSGHAKSAKNKKKNIGECKNDQTQRNTEKIEKTVLSKGGQSLEQSRSNSNRTGCRNIQLQNHSKGSNNNLNNCEANGENSNTQQSMTNDKNEIEKYSKSISPKSFLRTNQPSCGKNEIQNSTSRLNAAKLAQLHRLHGTIANSFESPSADPSNNVPVEPAAVTALPIISSPLPSLDSSKEKSVMSDMLPPLVAGDSSSQSSTSYVPDRKINVVRTSEVIVANIHSNIGVSNIYHMFRKFAPIYVSDIETVPEINVRFCYVYFGTAHDALEAEQSFDKVPLCGQDLITLRSHILEVESEIS